VASPAGGASEASAQPLSPADDLEPAAPEEGASEESEWVPVAFDADGQIVIRGQRSAEVGDPVGGQVESREDLSSLFVLGNAGVVVALLWVIYRVLSSM